SSPVSGVPTIRGGRDTEASTVVTPNIASSACEKTPVVPDHVMLRRVGKGAYGEVWLARNAIGAYHAVKIVRRADFRDAGPFEREFGGLQRFMPISRSHPG